MYITKFQKHSKAITNIEGWAIIHLQLRLQRNIETAYFVKHADFEDITE